MKFVKNTMTGQVLRWNEHMRNKDLVPCAAPFEEKEAYTSAFSVVNDLPDGIYNAPTVGDIDILSQREGELAVKELFGRDVSRVTISDMQSYAEEHGIVIPGEKPTKLQIISYLYAARGQKG